LPSDWGQPTSGGITRSISPNIRTVSSGPPPLPNRAPSSRPPPAWATPAATRELPRTTTPQALSQHGPSPSRFAKTKGLLAGALLGAAGALAAWAYQSFDRAEVEPTPVGSQPVAARATAEPAPGTAALSTSGAAPRATAPPEQDNEQLPVILNTDELPAAPEEVPLEEVGDEAAGLDVVPAPTVGSADQDTESSVGSGHAGRTDRANIPASVSVHAAAQSAPAPGAAAPMAGTSRASANGELNGSPRRATPTAVAARRDTPHRAKPASSADDCNPPYFFDENNIQRLKLECL
jgi:hypothetical protein